MNIDRIPTCAVCRRPVDSFTVEYDPTRDVRVFRADCHGETQQVALTSVFMLNADHVEMGLAFERLALR